MTVEERVKGFQQAMADVEAEFGVTVMPCLEHELLGDVVQVRPRFKYALIKGWVAEPPNGLKPAVLPAVMAELLADEGGAE